jgi:hypothetical protein
MGNIEIFLNDVLEAKAKGHRSRSPMAGETGWLLHEEIRPQMEGPEQGVLEKVLLLRLNERHSNPLAFRQQDASFYLLTYKGGFPYISPPSEPSFLPSPYPRPEKRSEKESKGHVSLKKKRGVEPYLTSSGSVPQSSLRSRRHFRCGSPAPCCGVVESRFGAALLLAQSLSRVVDCPNGGAKPKTFFISFPKCDQTQS